MNTEDLAIELCIGTLWHSFGRDLVVVFQLTGVDTMRL